tara:strand:+ start:265 stop:420 length:156 start_codon:yes stop_codon:yes gene_type:complete
MFEINTAKRLDPVAINKTWLNLSSLFNLAFIERALFSRGALFREEREVIKE